MVNSDQQTDHVTDNSAQLPQPNKSTAVTDHSNDDHDDDDDDDDDDENDDEDDQEDEDEIDWMDVEPPRQRAPPFIVRTTSRQRHTARPREPYLFNCVMTDEKPFVCTMCGECFRSV